MHADTLLALAVDGSVLRRARDGVLTMLWFKWLGAVAGSESTDLVVDSRY